MSIIELHYGQTSAAIDTKGGQIVSFRGVNGREVIWQADPSVWKEHAPLLFPICGTAKNGKLEIGGKSYAMPKHGFTRTNPEMKVAAQGRDYVDLVLTDNDMTRAVYPFAFAFHVTYSLFENGFRTQFLIENRDQAVMPMCVGGHPAFNCPMEDGAVFEDYDVVFEKEEDGIIDCVDKATGMLNGTEHLPFMHGRVLPLLHEEIDKRDSLLFSDVKSRWVRLVNRKTGRGLTLSFPKMEALAIWSMNGKFADFICLEPWHGTPAYTGESGRFEDKKHVTLLGSGETYVTWFGVRLDA